ncbi:hypothetical protein WT15_03360 [Burkholderia stagnalis]|uniref:ABC transporter substrate-binding protein n=1 Tax=Burkholderia stagnalis TaxID=1503054 RepID=A0ABX9YJ49_9BURK|nr:hypothetical protein WT74_17080 [Burkholderia stagnalis]KVN85588.1 hypothetical protein WT15_03360 [Burkholderia stagnalis]KWO32263.1 hypothetical protein WT95_14900 [Burkholderia stagnalis]KWO40972.1 hypothetical protein WT96_00045 [Burkholderia stagnalis]RQQ56720.1 hypothetical protein DF158_24130 [Burkholderia stagnalis]
MMRRRIFIHRALRISGAIGAIGAVGTARALGFQRGDAVSNRPSRPVQAAGYQVAVDYRRNLRALPSGIYASKYGDDGFVEWRADAARRVIRFELTDRARYWDGRPIACADIDWAWNRVRPIVTTMTGVLPVVRFESTAASARNAFDVIVDRPGAPDFADTPLPLLIRGMFEPA